ncbi:hypothetical protein ACHAXS_007435 [Conticribra weissflogii]
MGISMRFSIIWTLLVNPTRLLSTSLISPSSFAKKSSHHHRLDQQRREISVSLFAPSFHSSVASKSCINSHLTPYASASVRLWATSPASSRQPRTFGELLNNNICMMEATTCPCCSFLLKEGLFLPWNVEDDTFTSDHFSGGERVKIESTNTANEVMSPEEALRKIILENNQSSSGVTRNNLLLVDTHGHPHLNRDIQYAIDVSDESKKELNINRIIQQGVVSLACAVSPLDWDSALEYASQSSWSLPALGVHPWYLGDILSNTTTMTTGPDPSENTADVLDIEKYLNWEWLADLETHLSLHPHLLVGEIGLCKMAKFVREFPPEKGGKATALKLQKLVFRRQVELAAKWSRPVSVHCVNMHGSFLEVLRDILKDAKRSAKASGGMKGERKASDRCAVRAAFPPAIAMHSFTGTAHHAKELLEFEKELLHPEGVDASGRKRREQKLQSNGMESSSVESNAEEDDVLFYFGFSHIINHLMCTSEKARRKGVEAVRFIPSNRLLIESDVHAPEDVALGTAGALAFVAHIREEPIETLSYNCVRNGLKFLDSVGSRQFYRQMYENENE